MKDYEKAKQLRLEYQSCIKLARQTDSKKEEAELTDMEIGDFRKTIQDERLKELAYETLRKTDLVRWGIFVYNMEEVARNISADFPDAHFLRQYKNIQEKHLLWPVPAKEITLNRALTQNPNW